MDMNESLPEALCVAGGDADSNRRSSLAAASLGGCAGSGDALCIAQSTTTPWQPASQTW